MSVKKKVVVLRNLKNQKIIFEEPKKSVFNSSEEVYNLLNVWSQERIQKAFKKSRHNLVFNLIAELHNKSGYTRTAAEVKNKINNLKSQYRKLIPKSGGAYPTWPYFGIIHRILGQTDSCRNDLLSDTLQSFNAEEVDIDMLLEDESNFDESNTLEEVADDAFQEQNSDLMISFENEEFLRNIQELDASVIHNKSEEYTVKSSLKNLIPQRLGTSNFANPTSSGPLNDINPEASGSLDVIHPNSSGSVSAEDKSPVITFKKISRPPREYKKHESSFLKAYLESEKRYEQRLKEAQEREDKANEQEKVVQNTLINFLNISSRYMEMQLRTSNNAVETSQASSSDCKKLHWKKNLMQ